MDGAAVEGPVVICDDDHFYMGGLIAEKLRLEGLDVLLVTSASCLSPETGRAAAALRHSGRGRSARVGRPCKQPAPAGNSFRCPGA